MKYYIGIELGVKNIAAGILDRGGKMLRRDSIPTGSGRGFEEIIKDVSALVLKITEDEGLELKNIKYIGVGCPGIVDSEQGIVVKNYTLGFSDAGIKTELQKYINLPVYVENDANCVAVAEHLLGAAYGTGSSLVIKVGVGIGSGIIFNESIFGGFNFGGAEFGHMIIAYNGRECTCGRKGCWEQYVSATAMINQTKQLIADHPDSILAGMVKNNMSPITELTAFDAAKAGDANAGKLCSAYLEYMAEGLTNIINILMPEVIVIAGPVSRLGNVLIHPVSEMLRERVFCREIDIPEVRMSELGSAGIIVGAALIGDFKEEKLDDLV